MLASSIKEQDNCERKVLATAEAQMEPEKVPCGASSCSRWLGRKASGGATLFLPHCLVNPPFRSVQDSPLFCLKRLVLPVSSRFCPSTCSIGEEFVRSEGNRGFFGSLEMLEKKKYRVRLTKTG